MEIKDKVTMKVTEDAHTKLQLAKAHMGTKTFSETIAELSGRYLEKLVSKCRGK